MSTIEVYEAIKRKLGAEAAKLLLNRVEATVRDNVATKADLARLEAATREELAKLDERMASKEDWGRLESRLSHVEGRLEQMATRENLAKLENRLNVYFIILLVGILLFNPVVSELLLKLIGVVK